MVQTDLQPTQAGNRRRVLARVEIPPRERTIPMTRDAAAGRLSAEAMEADRETPSRSSKRPGSPVPHLEQRGPKKLKVLETLKARQEETNKLVTDYQGLTVKFQDTKHENERLQKELEASTQNEGKLMDELKVAKEELAAATQVQGCNVCLSDEFAIYSYQAKKHCEGFKEDELSLDDLETSHKNMHRVYPRMAEMMSRGKKLVEGGSVAGEVGGLDSITSEKSDERRRSVSQETSELASLSEEFYIFFFRVYQLVEAMHKQSCSVAEVGGAMKDLIYYIDKTIAQGNPEISSKALVGRGRKILQDRHDYWKDNGQPGDPPDLSIKPLEIPSRIQGFKDELAKAFEEISHLKVELEAAKKETPKIKNAQKKQATNLEARLGKQVTSPETQLEEAKASQRMSISVISTRTQIVLYWASTVAEQLENLDNDYIKKLRKAFDRMEELHAQEKKAGRKKYSLAEVIVHGRELAIAEAKRERQAPTEQQTKKSASKEPNQKQHSTKKRGAKLESKGGDAPKSNAGRQTPSAQKKGTSETIVIDDTPPMTPRARSPSAAEQDAPQEASAQNNPVDQNPQSA
ncbi:uncharacterized protein K452DRAFT_320778 [Aplosporella prunicola CBS 121167]|uniref:Uncharacterized protein n=1 Tax=Aplosporella prunicola CBS 121167 TaxID=1176127 RepID=A0A6A6B4Q9_9PEZI|nr:uncharacterized protein K452DRAFT_320778 [Aplosporella prunicola CBS 121167]KAF2139179.1 hypothetical protein K452DRAFT_320778 [Aplosporella prunicola CBS 121167]